MPKILLVEDDDAARYAFQRILQGAGYSVAAFGDYRDVVEAAREGDGDLLVVDINLPVGTPHGIALARMVRHHRPDMPVIFVTGFADLTLFVDMELGMVLLKPIVPQLLLRAVGQQLRLPAN
jgi:two-component system cell cycle sensor histidine kinase/response regulator CckA